MIKPSPIIAKKNQSWIVVSTILSLVLVLLGLFTLVTVQEPLQESQDIRQQASVSDGQVQMAFVPASGANIPLNFPTSVDFRVNTNGVQIDGVQLVFNVVTDTLSNPPEFVLASGSGMQIAFQQVQQVQDGYLVSLIVISQTIANPISTSDYTTIGQLNFTPVSTGAISLNFDVENSLATVFNSNPPTDELLTIATQNYTVVSAAPASPTPSPTTVATPTPTPTPAATPTTDTGNGTGGITVVSCNESCTSNAECQANQRCYNGQCRLVTNVSSTTCSQPTVANNGLNRSCNQYCADSRECASGYSCYYNRCRNPLNIESTSCAAPSAATQQAMAASCNAACTTHKDCGPNLYCYGATNTCRLVTNPGSTSCTPATTATVSNLYSAPKGGTGTEDTAKTPTTPKPVAQVTTTSSPSAFGSETGKDGNLPTKSSNALDAVGEYFQNLLQSRGVSLPIFLIAIGLLLLLIVIIISVLGRLLSKNRGPAKISPPGRDPKKDSLYEQKLAEKIHSLEEKPDSQSLQIPQNRPLPPMKPASMPPAAPGPMMPQRPPVSSVSSVAPTRTPTPSAQAVGPTSTPQPQPTQSTSMLDRLKDKGIKPPQN